MTSSKVKVKAPDQDWSMPKTQGGQQVDKDGLPIAKTARAIALAKKGKKTDPAGIVTADEIASHDPKAAEADREAVKAYKRGDQDAADQEMKPTQEVAEAAAQDGE